MEAEILEGEVVNNGSSAALAARPVQAIQEWTPRFAITVDEAVEMVEKKREFMRRVMREGEHYGVIPGTKSKPSLLKPGAELLLSSMGLHPRYRDTAPAIEDWTGTEHGGEPFFRYRKTCMITRSTGPSPEDYMVIAEAGGNCNSWEKKYRYRSAERLCPSCGKPAIIKGKAEYGGGWLCFKKKDGCGEKFEDTDVRITKQETGQVANVDIADLTNTLEKMADKRALVAATLLATGCSDIFTQDLEDGVDAGEMSGMSNGEVDHGDAGPEPAAAKQRNRSTQRTQGSDQRQATTAAPQQTGQAPAAAVTPASSEDVGKLVWLATALPRPLPVMKDEVRILTALKTSPYAGLLTRIKNEHLAQCGQNCSHLVEKEA